MKTAGTALLLCLFFLFNTRNCNAQNALSSPDKIDESGFGYSKVIGQDEDGYFLLLSNLTLNSESDRVGFKNRKYKVARYNNQLVRQWSKTVDPPDNSFIDAVTFFNGNVMIVTSQFLKQEQSVRCELTTINKSGTFLRHEHSATLFHPVTADYEKAKVIFSINRQQFAVLLREYTNDTSQTIFTVVKDTALQQVTLKSVTVPFSEKKFGFTGYALSVNGDLAIMGYHAEKVKSLSSKRKIEYYVYASGVQESTFREYRLPSDKNIGAIGLAFDNFNRKLVLSGFYFERESKNGAGIFYATLDITLNDEIKINTKNFESPTGSSIVRERSLSSGSGMMDYPIERIVIRNDGGAIIVAEAAYTTEYSFYDSFSQSFTQRTEYHFENVVVISVNSDASVDWSVVVEKDQVSTDDDGVFSSFCPLLNSEQLLLLYNDDISKRNKIVPAIVDSKGTFTRGNPLPTGEGSILLPRSGKQVSENQLLIPTYKKRELHLVLYTFE